MITDYNVEEKRRKEEEGKEERGKKIPNDLSKNYIAFFYFTISLPHPQGDLTHTPPLFLLGKCLYSHESQHAIHSLVSLSLKHAMMLLSFSYSMILMLILEIQLEDRTFYFQKLL